VVNGSHRTARTCQSLRMKTVIQKELTFVVSETELIFITYPSYDCILNHLTGQWKRKTQWTSVIFWDFEWEKTEIKPLKATNFNKAKPNTVHVFAQFSSVEKLKDSAVLTRIFNGLHCASYLLNAQCTSVLQLVMLSRTEEYRLGKSSWNFSFPGNFASSGAW
jgi:hypothetical protein